MSGVYTAGSFFIRALRGDNEAIWACIKMLMEAAGLPFDEPDGMEWPSCVTGLPTPTVDDLPDLFLEEPHNNGRTNVPDSN